MEQPEQFLYTMMDETIRRNASDLHLSVRRNPTVRIDGELLPLDGEPVLTAEDTTAFVRTLLTDRQLARLRENRDIDFAYSYQDKGRFRVNAFYQQGSHGVALRLLPAEIPSIKQLNLPPVLLEFTRLTQGFVLVVGPSGHGKSTTTAALLNEINQNRNNHIITIEDPVEYLFDQENCIIDQREVGTDALSFARALRAALRQDPDVIMVGEMRDRETVATALTAAETGHLVFATLHTNDAAQTIDRIIDSFPSDQQQQVRIQLAATLQGVVSLRLVPRIQGGRIPATEVLLGNAAVRNLIRERKTHQIGLVIETGAEEGMISLNKSLANLVQREEISLENAQLYSSNPEELRLLLGK